MSTFIFHDQKLAIQRPVVYNPHSPSDIIPGEVFAGPVVTGSFLGDIASARLLIVLIRAPGTVLPILFPTWGGSLATLLSTIAHLGFKPTLYGLIFTSTLLS